MCVGGGSLNKAGHTSQEIKNRTNRHPAPTHTNSPYRRACENPNTHCFLLLFQARTATRTRSVRRTWPHTSTASWVSLRGHQPTNTILCIIYYIIYINTLPYPHVRTGQPYNYDDQELSEQWMRTLAGDAALQSTVATQNREMVEAQVRF